MHINVLTNCHVVGSILRAGEEFAEKARATVFSHTHQEHQDLEDLRPEAQKYGHYRSESPGEAEGEDTKSRNNFQAWHEEKAQPVDLDSSSRLQRELCEEFMLTERIKLVLQKRVKLLGECGG